jgi:hypothetical protein
MVSLLFWLGQAGFFICTLFALFVVCVASVKSVMADTEIPSPEFRVPAHASFGAPLVIKDIRIGRASVKVETSTFVQDEFKLVFPQYDRRHFLRVSDTIWNIRDAVTFRFNRARIIVWQSNVGKGGCVNAHHVLCWGEAIVFNVRSALYHVYFFTRLHVRWLLTFGKIQPNYISTTWRICCRREAFAQDRIGSYISSQLLPSRIATFDGGYGIDGRYNSDHDLRTQQWPVFVWLALGMITMLAGGFAFVQGHLRIVSQGRIVKGTVGLLAGWAFIGVGLYIIITVFIG